MPLSIYSNLLARNVAGNLEDASSRLSDSVRRLSSGLRVNSAADDAAGLAIRELMRADVAAINQGVRNSNDAVSLIQTADSALGVIDEKLTRMKELAEQAATGTYDSIQRLIIDSEYQQMAKEISRIANATDFNGIHLLDGSLESDYHNGSALNSTGKLKVHFGTGNDSAEDYYYLKIGDMTAEGLSLGDGATVDMADEKFKRAFTLNLEGLLMPRVDSGEITQEQYDQVLAEVMRSADAWTAAARAANFVNVDEFRDAIGQTFSDVTFPQDDSFKSERAEGFTYTLLPGLGQQPPNWDEAYAAYGALDGDEKEKWQYAFLRKSVTNMAGHLANGNIFAPAPPAGPGPGFPWMIQPGIVIPPLQGAVREAGVEAAKEFVARHTYAGQNIRTQENAQHALGAIEYAVIVKDKARAALGANQNRLENTIANLQTQAENLGTAESRISDVDVGEEMTGFVRNQVLTQSALAMLSQANSLPQMAMQIIG